MTEGVDCRFRRGDLCTHLKVQHYPGCGRVCLPNKLPQITCYYRRPEMFEKDARLARAAQLRKLADVLTKEYEVDQLLKDPGPMSETYKQAREKLDSMRVQYDQMYGGATLHPSL